MNSVCVCVYDVYAFGMYAFQIKLLCLLEWASIGGWCDA